MGFYNKKTRVVKKLILVYDLLLFSHLLFARPGYHNWDGYKIRWFFLQKLRNKILW